MMCAAGIRCDRYRAVLAHPAGYSPEALQRALSHRRLCPACLASVPEALAEDDREVLDPVDEIRSETFDRTGDRHPG